MPETIDFLTQAEEAVKDFTSVSSQIEKQFKKADDQDTARKTTIQIIMRCATHCNSLANCLVARLPRQ